MRDSVCGHLLSKVVEGMFPRASCATEEVVHLLVPKRFRFLEVEGLYKVWQRGDLVSRDGNLPSLGTG